MKQRLHITVQYLKLLYQGKHELHLAHMHIRILPNESMGDIYCSQTFLEHQVERLLASLTGGSKLSVIISLSTSIQETIVIGRVGYRDL
jgi:hypothetical protein